MTLGRFSLFVITFVAGIAVCCSTCTAQNRGSMNQSRTTGQSSFGQSSFGQGQSSFGSTGGRGQSRGGFGSNSFGGNSFGGGGGTGFGNNNGRAGFGNNQAGAAGQDNFLGSDAAQTQNFFRNLNGGQRRNATFDFNIENLNEMRDRGNRGGNSDRTPSVRVKLRPTFATSSETMAQVSSEVHSRLATSLTDQGVVDSRVSSNGRTMTLEGRVGSEHQRALIEKILSLEPGVSTIENRLVVDPTLKDDE
jgi:hypothetical protein